MKWIGEAGTFFLNLYDFFYKICRLLICMFFANHILTYITDLYVGGTYTNLYHFYLATIYKLVYVYKILQICMIASYELVYIWFWTVQIQPYKLLHHLTIQIHCSPPHPKEEAQDEEQDDVEEEDVVTDEASVGSFQCDGLELSSSSIFATNYHPQLRLISKFCLPCFSLFVLPLTLLRFLFQFF
jgi:hypothetical protein